MGMIGWSSWLKGSCGWSANSGGLIDTLGEYPYIQARQSMTVVGSVSGRSSRNQ
jgi:hypothetical protein